ncbi:hypothetical protein [Tahibacter amnicola]|uniref:HPt domain-containing protein n=1 Tax=Tahibacter amnicola TaxID=2976241 RepID=A0ABY6B9C8_9GAMM|nr:hypothetical protein [Tahibacter amnicola]UXI65795.1 hypothetical protein N4264_13580 [Tahibacter amnicola]
MNTSPDSAAAGNFSMADVLVNAFEADAEGADTIAETARDGRDQALADLHTLSLMLRALKSGHCVSGDTLMQRVGSLVAHLTDQVEALTTLESHARYRREEIDRETRASEMAALAA